MFVNVNMKSQVIYFRRIVGSLVLCAAAVVYAAPVAHAQSCNEITALPVTLDTPGKWCVTRDLSWQNPSAPAIHITADNVQLDLMGHTISGQFMRCVERQYLPNGSASPRRIGIKAGERNQPVKNIRVTNGTIKAFAIGMAIYSQNFFLKDLDILRNARIGITAIGNGKIDSNKVRITGGTRCSSPSWGVYLVDGEVGNGFSVTRNVIASTWSEYNAVGLYAYGRIYAAQNSIVNTTRVGMQISTRSRPAVLFGNHIENTGQYYSNQGRLSRRGEKGLQMFIPRDNRRGTYIGYRGNSAIGFDEGFTVGFTGEYRDWGNNVVR